MKRTTLTLLATASVIATAMPALAQEAPAATEAADDATIIVTARKREENLVDVPLPVSVATAAQLKRDQVNSITDLQRTTPALEVSQSSGGEVNGGARLRGIGTGVFNASVSPSVAFVIDQVPQGNIAFPFLFDMAQVEVLRGPQGTLFGQGASAGVINVSTVAPTTDRIKVSGGVQYADKGTAGSEVGETIARGAFNLPLSDSVALRVAGQYKQEKGLQRNTFLGLDNDIRDFGMRGRLLIKPSDVATINVSAEYASTKMKGWNFFAPAFAPTSTASLANYYDKTGCNMTAITFRADQYCEDTQANMLNTTLSLAGTIDYDLSDNLTLTSVTSYREGDRQTRSVNFSRRLVVAARTENQDNRSSQFTQELRLDYKGERFDLIVGGMYAQYQLESTPINGALGFNNVTVGNRTGFSVCHNLGFFCVVPLDFSYENTKNYTAALFGDATFNLTDKLDLFGGLRFTDYKNTTGVGIDVVAPTRTRRISDNNLSGRVGLRFKPNPDTTFYGSYARGYKPPALVVPTIATDPVTLLNPEKADAFEIGAKARVGRLQLSGNVFYSKVNGFQAQFQEFSGSALISVTRNISNVTSKGFELGVMGQVAPNLSVNAGYQYNDVRFPAGYRGNDGGDLSNTQFLNAPKHKVTFSGEFTQPVASGIDFFLNANVVYKTQTLLAAYADPRFRFPAHALVNGGLGVRDAEGKWTASIFARNLTKQREPIAYLLGDFSGAADGGIRAWPAAGLTARVVGIALDFSY